MQDMESVKADIESLRRQLEIHRKSLRHLEEQKALHGDLDVPLQLLHSIDRENENISRIKAKIKTLQILESAEKSSLPGISLDFEAWRWDQIMHMTDALVILNRDCCEVARMIRYVRKMFEVCFHERRGDFANSVWVGAVEEVQRLSCPETVSYGRNAGNMLTRIRYQLAAVLLETASLLSRQGKEESRCALREQADLLTRGISGYSERALVL